MSSQLSYLSLLPGAFAGTSVDLALYPVDTIKTRFQSTLGFWKAGGFKGVYSGLGAAALGSAPCAALFFGTYDFVSCNFLKQLKRRGIEDQRVEAVGYMAASAIGETVAALVRVPTENVKQKMQAGLFPSMRSAVRGIINSQGFKGFYRGFCATLALEVPFGIVQFPVWEFSKQYLSYRLGKELTPWQAALCGSFAGTTAAVCTNPLDVARTRQILDINGGKYADKSITSVLRSIAAKEGLPGLFSGLAPRVIWISMGGFIFFGAYSHLKKIMIERDSNAWNIEGF